ncbi:tetratricopeptide repeat protein [Fontivita pretiosa]|uniref:tetratricopeptide repeat protein n=1 Tax=Fontivita pretiosa TaxID=2989684 RepID=UPI003D16F4FA
MNIRSKTCRRLLLLAGVVVALLLAGAVVVKLRQAQIAAKIVRDRDEGYAALEAGDYFTAMHKVGPFLQRNPDDPQALFAYARARARVGEINDKHVAQAMALLRRLLELKPDHAEARAELLELCLRAGFMTEVLRDTEHCRDDDAVSLRARATALGRLRRYEQALPVSRRYNELRPFDVTQQIFTLSLMRQLGLGAGANARDTAGRIVARARELRERHGGDPRFDLLEGVAWAMAGDEQRAMEFISAAAANPIRDHDFITALSGQLTAMGRHEQALEVLERAADSSGGDAQLEQAIVNRLFRAGRYEQVYRRLSQLRLDDRATDVELLALRGMAALELKRDDQARAVLEALRQRRSQRDLLAGVWAQIIEALYLSDAAGAQAEARLIDACRQGLRLQRDNAYFRCYLGDAYERAGELEAALNQWRTTAGLAPGWPAPAARMARLLAAAGRTTHAQAAAQEALRRLPGDPQALRAMGRVMLQRVRNHELDVETALRQHEQALQTLRQDPELIVVQVALLVEAGRNSQAADVIRSTLRRDAGEWDGQAMLELARLSARTGQEDLERQCLESYEKHLGHTAELAYELAVRALRGGDLAQAMGMLQPPDPKQRDTRQWRLARARLLELAGRQSQAAAEWVGLADAHPQDAQLQQLALAAASVRPDRAFRRRAIDRLARLIGEDGLRWRLADAELNVETALSGDRNAATSALATAAAALSDLCQRAPNVQRARLLLAECMLRLGQQREAIEQLTAAVQMDPSANAVAIRLVGLLQSRGLFEQAKPHLDRLEQNLRSASAASSDEWQWRTVARLLGQRGETDRAIALLKDLEQRLAQERMTADDRSPDVDLELARLYRRRGILSEEYCRKLLSVPSAETIAFVADYYAQRGDRRSGDELLMRLDSLPSADGSTELLRAEYLERRGDRGAALARLTEAVRKFPDDRRIHKRLIAAQLRDGGLEAALAASAQAGGRFADDPSFAAMNRQANTIRKVWSVAATMPAVRELVTAILEAPEYEQSAAEALSVVQAGLEQGQTASGVLRKLRPIADRTPQLRPLQDLVTRLAMSIGRDQEAVETALRTMRMFPGDPQPAQLAVEALSRAGRWAEVIPAATQWRARLGDDALAADLALATAYLHVNDAPAAVRQLAPYAPRAFANGQLEQPLAGLLLRAQVQAGQVQAAEAQLRPLLPGSASARAAWIWLASQHLPGPQVAGEWLSQLAEHIPAETIDEQLSLARGWQDLARRTSAAAHWQQARELLRQLTAAQQTSGVSIEHRLAVGELCNLLAEGTAVAGDAESAWRYLQDLSAAMFELDWGDAVPARQWMILGGLMQRHDPRGAEQAYRRAIRHDPTLAIAKNNLAIILAQRGGDLHEAMELAQFACAQAEHPDRARFLDTLAYVQAKMGEYEGAAATWKQAIELDPNNLAWRIRRTQALIQAGRYEQAKASLAELERVAPQQQMDSRMRDQLQAMRAELK